MHRRSPALALALAAAAVALTSAIATLRVGPSSVALARRADPTATPPSTTTRSGCRVESARDVDAPRVGLTDTVGVTLTVRGCMPEAFPLHVAFVLDTNLGERDDVRDVRSAIDALVTKLDLPSNPRTEVAVVSFGAAVRTLTGLTNDEDRVRGAVRRAGGAQGDAVGRGLDAGRSALRRGRVGSERDATREVLILYSNAAWAGGRDGSCATALAAAGQVKGEGILLITVLSGSPSNDSVACMRSIATSPRYFFESRQLAQLSNIFLTVRHQIDDNASMLVNLVITDTVGPGFDVDPAAISPPPSTTSPDGRTLRWQLPATITWPAAAISVTYRLRPTALGTWPVSLGATAAFTDARAASGTVAFPPVSVEVVDPASTDARVCPSARAAVPADVIAAALAHPERVSGWDLRCSASQPPGPANPLRDSLRLARPGMAYHPLANGLLWACGCR